MDFGLDNEFDSDDSFFDDPKLPKKVVPNKTTEKKSLDDIFGFQDEKNLEKSEPKSLENVHNSLVTKPKVRFNIEESTSNENIEKNTEPSKSSMSKKAFDWLETSDDLDLPKKDSISTKASQKSDVLDDILATTPSKTDSKKSFDLLDDILPHRGQKSDQKKTTSFEDILRDSKVQKSGPSSFEKTSLRDDVKQKSSTGSLEDLLSDKGQKGQISSSDGVGLILEPPKGQTFRRGRRTSNTGITDVLGLFGSGPSSGDFGGEAKESGLDEKKSRAANKSVGQDIPDWLGGSSTTINKSDTTISSQKTEIKDNELIISERKVEQETKNVRESTTATNTEISEEKTVMKLAEDYPRNVSKTVENVTQHQNFQTSMSNLQTQESFLLVSLQLKKYEENLMDIKQQQEEILRKQENHFDVFLNTYIEKQKHIEQEMLTQQERINEHIRILAIKNFEGAKSISKQDRNQNKPSMDNYNETMIDNDGNKDGDVKNDTNSPVEKIVESLKQRHNEEYFLMEESYKKQISLLEKSGEQVEHRLNQEIENVSKIYEEKLENVKTQHNEEIKYWTEKIKNIEENHKNEMDNIKENHGRVLSEIKNEFLDQVERFKERTNRENELFSNSGKYTQKLNISMEKLEKNEHILENLQEKVINDYGILSVARERSIETKEKEITMMRDALEKCRNQAEKERSQLLALIRTLEQKISEQSQNSQEERWALQQAAATIAARSVAFDREVEFSRASIEREREQLKTLKETLLAEQERDTLQLTEEKLKLNAEKSRLEVSAKLVNNYEVEKIKTEAETAIQVAKELTDKLNLERNFVQRQKIDLENYRSKLVEKERDLLEREEYLEEMKRTMQQKMNDDRRVMQEAKFLETRYKEKLSELQMQATNLSNREKKLAEEKLLISKERLALYTSMKSQKSHKKCMLCKAEEENLCKDDAFFLGPHAIDPDLMRLRIEAVEDERNSEVSREDNSPNIRQNKD